MSNSFITKTELTNESLRLLHQKLNFVGNIDKSYEDMFGKEGNKIGSSLRVRKRNQFTTRSGETMQVQDITEDYFTLTVGDPIGVDFDYKSVDWALSLDKFSERYLEPAMARLAAAIESDVLTTAKNSVYQQVNNVGSSTTFLNVLNAGKKLDDSLAPDDDKRVLILNTQSNVDLIDVLKGLPNPAQDLSSNYRRGKIGSNLAGFGSVYRNTLMPSHTAGTDASAYLVNEATAGDDGTVTVNTGTGTFKKGDIITLAGCNSVHPETKVSTGELMQFVVTADVSGNATSIPISPTVITSGARQNVSGYATNGGAVTKVGGNAATYDTSLAFHPEAFTIAFIDEPIPGGMHVAKRSKSDGISLRYVEGFDIVNNKFNARFDVRYAFGTPLPQLACRIATNS